MRHFGFYGLICLLTWLTPYQVSATESPLRQSEQLAEEARVEREARRYNVAITLYLKAHQIQADSAFLYNIAFIYDRDLGDTRNAKKYYRQCIDMKDANPVLVERSKIRLKSLNSKPQSTPSGNTALPSAQASVVRKESNGAPVWISALGGITLIAGGVTGLVARHDAEQFKAATVLDEKLGFRDSAEAKALVADGLMLAGSITLLVGVTWLFADSTSEEKTTHMYLTPAGFAVQGAF